jgi:biotin transport system substrate-specific component
MLRRMITGLIVMLLSTPIEVSINMHNPTSPSLGNARVPVLTNTMLDGIMPSNYVLWRIAGILPISTHMTAKALLVVVGSLLLAASAQFKIPLYPVPVTGQTLVVLLIGMTYGPRLGGFTVATYLLQGSLGLPVFAGAGFGIATLLGPTGGYLFGFLAASVVMGLLAERGMGRHIISTLIAMIIGNVVIYVMGASWLANFIGAEKALAAGVLPFLYGDALKLMVAAGLMPLAWRLVKGLQK